jgi:hypothetical protein
MRAISCVIAASVRASINPRLRVAGQFAGRAVAASLDPFPGVACPDAIAGRMDADAHSPASNQRTTMNLSRFAPKCDKSVSL